MTGAPVPSAVVGTLMLRRGNVLGRLKRHQAIYRENMRKAEAEGNEPWREVQLAKLRAITALMLDIIERCPVFENAQAIEARRDETQGGSVHESAVGTADAPETPLLTLPH